MAFNCQECFYLLYGLVFLIYYYLKFTISTINIWDIFTLKNIYSKHKSKAEKKITGAELTSDGKNVITI